jgi:hypothetical protein
VRLARGWSHHTDRAGQDDNMAKEHL